MAKVFNYITINYEKDIYTPSIDMMQGDTGRGLTFSIASPIDGLDDEISNLTATLNVVKPTGETQTVTGTIESLGNDMAKVTIEPSSNLARAINVSGLANATLVIANATQTVTSFNFKIKIKPNPFYPKPTVRKFDVTKVSRITGVQQYEHCVQSIEFVGLNYTGNMYIVLNNDTFVQDSETEGYHNTVPLTNNTFIIGQPMTFYSGVFSCQLLGETTSNGETTKFEISPIFYIEVAESIEQGEETEYPIDPNITFGIDEYITEVKEQAQSEIEATGDAVIESIPSDYTALEQATYNAYPTQSESGNPIYFDDGADDIPVKELIVNLEPKQSGTGDPSPTNVRPITGYDGATIRRTGKNLLQLNKSSYTYKGVTYTFNSDGSVTLSGTATEAIDIVLFGDDTIELPTGTYIFSGVSGGSGSTCGLALRIRNNNTSTNRYVFCYSGETTFEMADGEVINRVYANIKSGVTVSMTVYPMIRVEGSTPYYSKYNGTSYSITFPSSVGTVYGGTLNVTTGELTVDRAMVTLNGTNYPTGVTGSSSTDTVLVQTIVPNIALVNDRDDTKVISDYLKTSSDYDIYRSSSPAIAVHYAVSEQQRRLWLRLPNITSEADAKSYLASNPLTVVYPLATPTTYQLTPTEVSTLLGSNTIQSDGSMELDYRADTTKVIEKLTNAIISLGGNV